MLKTNENKLVMAAVQGSVAPMVRRSPWAVDAVGKPFALPGVGGITYNIKSGDPCFGWMGDHIEAGVTTILDSDKRHDPPNIAYNFLSCIGNRARVITGDAKGTFGTVLGTHGGVEHVILDFDDKTLDKLTNDDKFLIKTHGQGLKLLDYPEIDVWNLDPTLLHKMQIAENKDGTLNVGVSHRLPGCLMGSGVGAAYVGQGDYDIMTTDREYISELGLDKLRYGDIVAIMDHDNAYGRSYRRGAVVIGVVVHGDCLIAGHGPGVVTILASVKPIIKPVIDKNANIASILEIGRFRTTNELPF